MGAGWSPLEIVRLPRRLSFPQGAFDVNRVSQQKGQKRRSLSVEISATFHCTKVPCGVTNGSGNAADRGGG